MFGYIVPHLESLDNQEQARYRAVYCGVCRSLEQRYGQFPRLTTSYDMTFLALLLNSLYEPDEFRDSQRCPLHPGATQAFARSEYTDYAADLSIILGYYKCLDDWRDDRSRRAWLAARALEKPYRRALEHHSSLGVVLEQAMNAIHAVEEEQAASNPDAAANCFGALLGDVFVYRNDFWAHDLRRFGARLGKFIYMMDAALDIDDDRKQGNYNPFLLMEADRALIQEDLEMLAAAAVDSFERLPLEQDAHLMRSVLYAGMWQRFKSKEKTEDHG